MEIVQIDFLDIPKSNTYKPLIKRVMETCFKEEELYEKKLYVNIILTNPKNIKEINNKYRNINKETDVLSFPMFEKEELENIKSDSIDILGDIVISIERVKKQAIEYEHSFERELAYMLVHGFYHLMGYDHIEQKDKKEMRKKEENVLQKLNIIN